MPSALTDDCVRLVPLGGLGQFGMNCLALEQRDGILVIDCGTSFPHDDLGVDVLHPDFAWLKQRASDVRGVFITHGHEDHIGGLPYFLSELRVPVWAPAHALGLVRARLLEHEFGADTELHEAIAGTKYRVGPFEVEPIRVSHSICEATALKLDTRAGSIVHTGDFNMDADPPDGEPTDVERLQRLGDEGVTLLLSDSTNVDVAERRGSERTVGVALEELVKAAPERVFIAIFASNVQRLILLGQIAERSGRKLCLFGRSLNTQVEVARRIGRLHWPSDLCVAAEQVQSLPRDQVLVLAGGSQAERNSALRRLSNGSHQQLALEADDTVILSSRIIPGNELAVFEMIGDLLRCGVRLHTTASDPGVHTSGHAGRSEQRRMLQLLRPRSFIPLHGTLHHLRRHAELARSEGVSDVLVLENGSTAVLDADGLRQTEPVPYGKVPIAIGGERLDKETLWRRAELGRAGIVTVSLVLDRQGRVLAGPEISSIGVPLVDRELSLKRGLGRALLKTLERVKDWQGVDLCDELRRSVRKQVFDACGCRPTVEVHLLTANG